MKPTLVTYFEVRKGLAHWKTFSEFDQLVLFFYAPGAGERTYALYQEDYVTAAYTRVTNGSRGAWSVGEARWIPVERPIV